jgi:protein-tyrosine phosphatase
MTPMLRFTDTHNHIIPAVDDGSPDMETSIEMAKIAAADGIGTIVATPHLTEGYYEGEDISKRIAGLQHELDARGINIKIVAGAEVPMSFCMGSSTERLRALSIGGKYLLIESAETTFDQIVQAAYQVRLSGLRPVLAHPERTSFVRSEPGKLGELVAREEVFCQITVASLEGLFGPRVSKNCRKMLKHGLVHLLATDAHSDRKRSPRLSPSYAGLQKLVGNDNARLIVVDNPENMVAGRKMSAPQGETSAPRRLLGRLTRRP